MAVPNAHRITLTWEPDPSADVFPADHGGGSVVGLARTVSTALALGFAAVRSVTSVAGFR